MRTIFLFLIDLAIIHGSSARSGGVIQTLFSDSIGSHIGVDLAIFGGSVRVTCEIECDVDATVELIDLNRVKVSSGKCQMQHSGSTVAYMHDLEINESLAFGDYKCKYKDRIIEDRASSWVNHYRTCSEAERQNISELNPKRIFVVDTDDRTCHMVRDCGDRQHIGDRLISLQIKIDMPRGNGRRVQYGISGVFTCEDLFRSVPKDPAWYISYAGNPIVLNSLVPIRKEIRNLKIHCPASSDKRRIPGATCEVNGVKVDEGNVVQCSVSGTADVLIPDGVFGTSGGKPLHCSTSSGYIYATLIYVARAKHVLHRDEKWVDKMRFRTISLVQIRSEVTHKMFCWRNREHITRGLGAPLYIIPGPDQCEEYKIVAEATYVHPGTHEVFRVPLMESRLFHKKKPVEISETTSATPSVTTRTYPVTGSNTVTGPCPNPTMAPCKNCNCSERILPQNTDGNSADLIEPGSWWISMATWLISQLSVYRCG